MYAKKFSPIDVPWLSTDPGSACCMCPDDFRERGEPVDYCPQHGDRPDYSMCHDAAAGRKWREENGLPITADKDLPRMRIHRGRVMHRVERTADGYRSLCRKPHPVKGVNSTIPRADSYADDWTTDRHWYPDCQHCPPDNAPKPSEDR